MDLKLQNKLFEKYPKIFKQRDLSPQETCMCWGINCGDGWYDIIDRLCFLIQSRVEQPHKSIEMYEEWIADSSDQSEIESWKKKIKEEKNKIISVEFVQVKEKFASLRIYHTSDNAFISGLIAMAESVSAITCEKCGNKGVLRKRGWMHILCDRCDATLFSREIP